MQKSSLLMRYLYVHGAATVFPISMPFGHRGKAGPDCSPLALGRRSAPTQTLKPVGGWRQQEGSQVEDLLSMVGDLCEGTGKEDGRLTKGSQGASELCWPWASQARCL